MLPAMLVAGLAPQGTQLQREESPGCSCHVSPSIPKCKWQPKTPRAEEATGLRLRPRPLTVWLARPPAPSAAGQPSLSSRQSPASGPRVRVKATLPALVCPVCGLLPQASPQEPRAGLLPLGEQGPEGNREPGPRSLAWSLWVLVTAQQRVAFPRVTGLGTKLRPNKAGQGAGRGVRRPHWNLASLTIFLGDPHPVLPLSESLCPSL